jgi:predicted Zn-dependent peptidase
VKTRTIAALILIALAAALPAQAAFKLPAPEKILLKNGITVYYLRTTETPIVSFRLMLRGAGSAQEPAALEGIASLTAELLQKGTATLSADGVAEAVDFMGARFGVNTGEEMVTLSADSLSEHFPRLLAIAADCLTGPAFSADEFQKAVKTRRDSLKAVKDSPGAAVRSYFAKAYYGSHPLGHLSNGTEESLAKMTLADVQAYYKTYYGPAKAVAAVVGDIDRAALVTLLNAALGKWKGAKVAVTALPPLPKPQGIKLLLVDKPDATQAYWILGAPGYALGDPVTPAAAVMNTLFGGRFTSWLMTELRIKRGLTYGANSSFATFSSGGTFTASSYTKNDKIGEMLQIVFDLLKKARIEGFTAEELTSSRNYIQGQFPPTIETNASKAGAYARLAFFGLGFDYYDRYLAGVQGTDPQAAQAAAAKLLPSDGYVLVVVGKKAEIKAQLDRFGTWAEKKISDPGF